MNPGRIGATGASGGATQTFLLAGVDDRIQFDAPANMVSLIYQGGGVCENAPSLRLGANNVEFAAMMAPRPMLITGATGDWTRNMLREEYPAVRAIYDLYGKGENVETWFQNAPHNYNQPNREAMYAFFGKHMCWAKTMPPNSKRAASASKSCRTCWRFTIARCRRDALTFEQLNALWMRMSGVETGDRRERLTLALAARLAFARAQPDRRRPHPAKPRRARRPCPRHLGEELQPREPGGAGGPSRRRRSRASHAGSRAVDRRRRSVLMIDAFQTGGAVAPRDRTPQMFLTFNKSDDANRVQDILTALAWLSERAAPNAAKPLLVGQGKAAVWVLFAAAVSPVPVELRADLSRFAGTDDDYIADFFVPGIQRAGGLGAAKELTGLR